MLKDLVVRNRSYRRFDETVSISLEDLRELVDLARLSASAANRQPLKYVLSCDRSMNDAIFSTLAWAAYLKEWLGPDEGERPSAYVVVLHDTTIAEDVNVDPGIACQSILLGAVEKGLGGCILGNVKRDHLRGILKLADRYEILYVVALGKPAERVLLEEVGPDGDIRYYRDEDDVHHVPKRTLHEVILDTYPSPWGKPR